MTVQTRPLASDEIEALRGLSREQAKTLALASLGGALEYYDFIVGVFFAKTLAAVFFPHDSPQWLSQLQVFGIFAAGYLVRPIGGVVFAHFGDRVGRKRMFALGLFLMAFPTLLVGLTPDYQTIGFAAPLLFLFCRLLQGLSVGGEVPGAWIFCAEHVHKSRVGFACGLLMGGLCCGILMGALTAKILTASLAANDLTAWGWRIPFILGGVFGLISVYLRKHLRETPVFEALRERRVADAGLPISLVFTRCKSEVLVSMAATWVFAGVFVTYFLYLPTYLQSQFDYRAADVFTANCWSISLLILGSVFVGRMTDIIGGEKAYAIGGAAMAAVIAALGFSLGIGGAWTLHLYAIGGFTIGTITLTPYLIIRSFPPELRFTGFALSYNTAYAIIGGTTPPLMALLVGERALPTVPFYYMTALCLLGAAIGLLRGER